MKLAIACMTRLEPFTTPFLLDMLIDAEYIGAQFVAIVDNNPSGKVDAHQVIHTQSAGYFESAWDEALKSIDADYILRLDDDETISPPLLEWLKRGDFQSDLYAFPRVHLWGNQRQCIINNPLYPDLQTRLSTKAKAGGRNQIHAGSPYGTGHLINMPIEHHKFLVRSRAERERIAAHYEAIRPGAGMSATYRPFNLPETCFDRLEIRKYANGEITAS